MKGKRPSFPKAARRLIGRVVPREDRADLLSDYAEIYDRIVRARGRACADAWIVKQAGKALPVYLGEMLFWRVVMFRNNFKIALRNFKRDKGFSAINTAGLVLGLAITLVITLYVMDDLTFDRFHTDPESVYRVLSIGKKRGTINSITAGPLIAAFKDGIPEVKAAVRVATYGRPALSRPGEEGGSQGEDRAVRALTVAADSAFFDVFSFEILAGDGGAALDIPGSFFFTPALAKAVFGDEDPLGKPLQVRGIEDARVVGLVAPPPPNSHVQFEAIFSLIPSQMAVWWDSWDNLGLMGYIRLQENADPEKVTQKMIQVGTNGGFAPIFQPGLQPLLDVHLGSADFFYDFFNSGKNDALVVTAMAVVGIMILLIACINFVNLSTSRATRRAREVGMRKVVGSSKGQLVSQFLGESVMLSILTFLLAAALVSLILPYLGNILNKTLTLSIGDDAALLLVFFAGSILIGILSGIYPALVLSSFRPVNVLKDRYPRGSRGILMRRILVVFQFSVTTALIVGVFLVMAQVRYLQSRDMGYNREQVLVVVDPLREGDDLLKQRMLTIPGVISAGRISTVPQSDFLRMEIIPEGFDRESNFTASNFFIDEDFFETLQIEMLAGRGFSREFPTDKTAGLIVNQTLIEKSNYTDPVGRSLQIVSESGDIEDRRIVAVIKDFHYLTSRQAIEPMIFEFNTQRSPMLMTRIAPGQTAATIERIESEYKRLYPDRPINRFFLDEPFNQQFNRDREFMRNIGIFAGIAILIACLGLIGLVAHAVERQRKSIVIRKVLGCGHRRIFTLLAVDFLKWVGLACLIAWPMAYIAMSRWLNGFVYRVSFQIWPFAAAAAASLLFALATISFQTLRAANANPADVLRLDE